MSDTQVKMAVELAECYVLYRDETLGLKEWATLASRQKFNFNDALLRVQELRSKDPSREVFIVATLKFERGDEDAETDT